MVLGWRAPDGTFRARIHVGGVKVWECTHHHATIEAAWECGERQVREMGAGVDPPPGAEPGRP